MGLSSTIDIALGLALMFLFLSLICTTINEIISTALKLRAKSLSKACSQLIDNEDLRRAFYNNGLIANIKSAAAGGAPQVGSPAAPSSAATAVTANGFPKDKGHPSYIDSRTFAMALLSSLGDTPQGKSLKSGYKSFPTAKDIEDIVNNLPPGNIKDVLQASLAAGDLTVAEIRNNLATSFDKAMDRLSGHYRRQIKWLAFATGALVAICLNADSVHVSSVLWNDQGLRSQIANLASTTAQGNGPGSKCTQDEPAEKAGCLASELKGQSADLRPFPIGWSRTKVSDVFSGSGWDVVWNMLCKFVGIALTASAISLGAPFWFDLLQRLTNIRGTGPKPSTEAHKSTAGV